MPANKDRPPKAVANPVTAKPQPVSKGKVKTVRTKSGKFEKGHSGNPEGKNGTDWQRQLFGTRDPVKQAIIRKFKEKSEKASADELARFVDGIIEKGMEGNVSAFSAIAERLDGPVEKNPPIVQQNTLQVIIHNMRTLNLTKEQRDELLKLTVAPTIDARPAGGQ